MPTRAQLSPERVARLAALRARLDETSDAREAAHNDLVAEIRAAHRDEHVSAQTLADAVGRARSWVHLHLTHDRVSGQ